MPVNFVPVRLKLQSWKVDRSFGNQKCTLIDFYDIQNLLPQNIIKLYLSLRLKQRLAFIKYDHVMSNMESLEVFEQLVQPLDNLLVHL